MQVQTEVRAGRQFLGRAGWWQQCHCLNELGNEECSTSSKVYLFFSFNGSKYDQFISCFGSKYDLVARVLVVNMIFLGL